MDPAPNFRLHDPQVTVFICEHCCGQVPLSHGLPVNCRLLRCCAGEVGAGRLREAFADGADGVLVLGCVGRHCCVPGDDMAAFIHIHEGTMALHRLGLNPVRLHRLWLTPREASGVMTQIVAFRRRLAALGPRRKSATAPVPVSAAGAVGA